MVKFCDQQHLTRSDPVRFCDQEQNYGRSAFKCEKVKFCDQVQQVKFCDQVLPGDDVYLDLKRSRKKRFFENTCLEVRYEMKISKIFSNSLCRLWTWKVWLMTIAKFLLLKLFEIWHILARHCIFHNYVGIVYQSLYNDISIFIKYIMILK